LDTVAGLVNRIALYLPNVLVAILVLVFGTLLARFLNRLMFAWLNTIKAPAALALSTGVEYAVQVFALFVALEQLQIGARLLTVAFAIAFGGVVLTLALAFGLGGRDWAAERLKDWSRHRG
jgi:predicted Co/Zn/Cd cation transporter (cation efflux family)